jgi:ATP-dependent protease HslVU (ClpYQ) peptidase subunit
MTTIAYKDGVLACDSAWSEDSRIIGLITKIKRLDTGVLYGAAGAGDDRALLTLLQKVREPDDLPSCDDLWNIHSDISALVVFPDQSVYLVYTGSEDCGVMPLGEPAAVGSGKWLAIGAMEAGKSAVDAVKIACKRDCHSKGPVHSLALK